MVAVATLGTHGLMSRCGKLVLGRLHCSSLHTSVQVATEWLFSVPDHILHKHLASDPNTPVAEVASPEDHRVFTPRRVRLQVSP